MGKSCSKSSVMDLHLESVWVFLKAVMKLVSFRGHSVFSWLSRPMRGGEKLELHQPMLPGLQREQQRPPHLHPPPPHRAWEQLGQLYESHLPPQGHPVVPLPNEHTLRLHSGGYAGGGGPPPNSHIPHTRPNQLLKVRNTVPHHGRLVCQSLSFSRMKKMTIFTPTMLSLLFALVWGSSGAACSQGSTTAGR